MNLQGNEMDLVWMSMALELARSAPKVGEVPVGALLVKDGKLLSTAFNLRETKQSPLAHAELVAMARASAKLNSWRLVDTTLYVTLEPCVMCTGAIIQSRIARVVFGAKDPKGGAMGSLYDLVSDGKLNHRPEVVGGILAEPCSGLLKEFFSARR